MLITKNHLYVRAENPDGTLTPAILGSDPVRYELTELKDVSSGTVLPTVGIIVEF